MRIHLKKVIVASTLVVGIAAAQSLYAHASGDAPNSDTPAMTQCGMMGQGKMGGRGNMTGMMPMMGQMHRMMETHGGSMQTMMDQLGTTQSGKE
jgi:hypothetical protein